MLMDGTTAVIIGQKYTEESLKAHMSNCAVVSPAVEHWKKLPWEVCACCQALINSTMAASPAP